MWAKPDARNCRRSGLNRRRDVSFAASASVIRSRLALPRRAEPRGSMMRGTLQCELKSGGSCRGERGRGGGRGRGDVGVGQRQTNLSCPRAGSEARRALWVDMLGRSSRGAAGRCYDRRRYRSSEASWAGREGENSSTLASLGGFFAAKFMPHLLLDPSHQRFGSRAVTQRRTRRATDRAAGYHTVARSMAGMCSPVLFHRRPAARPGLRLWRAPAQ